MASDGPVSLAEYVRRMRLRAGLTQEELAERAGLTVDTVGALERELRHRLYPHTARALADALGLSEAERAELAALAHVPAHASTQVSTRQRVPAVASAGTPPGNLPVPLTSFVGRERELAAAALFIAAGARLLTLTGPGGAGKTRLALEAARAVSRHFPAGVWYVDLAPLTDPALVPQTVATVLGVRDAPGRSVAEGIVAAVGEQPVLLVLDNCEHLLDACAALVLPLLQQCPRLTIVATSRAPLGISGEQVYGVPPLALPPAAWTPASATVAAAVEFAAVHLFVDRVRAARPDFALTVENVGAVVDICRRLDGLPLALELAAARVRVLSPQQIAARLDDRFRLVAGASRDSPPRHQTLRSLIDWSYELLTEPERALLRRLSVFAGGFSLEAAEAVCDLTSQPPSLKGRGSDREALSPLPFREGGSGGVGDVLDLLTALVDKSLVVAEVPAGSAHYRLLESVREYAAEKLEASGETMMIRDQHLDWCLAHAEALGVHSRSVDQAAGVAALSEDFPNLRAAFTWSLSAHQDPARGLQLAVALHACWAYLGFVSEGRDWYKQALAAAGTAHTLPRAEALKNDGILAWLAHDYPAGIASAAAAVELARALEADSLRVLALRALALNAEALGDSVRAREALEEALTLARAIDDQRGLAYVLECLGAMAVNDGNQTTAREWLTEGLSVARAASVNSEAATIVRHLGWCALLDGDVGEAQDRFREALVLSVELNHATLIALTFVGIAVSAGLAGNSMRAARLLGVWDELSGRFGISVPPRQQATVDRVRETLLGVLGPGEMGTALADGRALTLAEAITYALEETTSDIQPRQPA